MEKVVGTTFVEQKQVEDLVGRLIPKKETKSGVPEFTTAAILVPEPTNPYDPTAVAVIVKTVNGEAHRIGYLARNSETKLLITKPIVKKLRIKLYEEIGMTNSYVLED